jgi:signal peptidase II
MPVFSRRLRWLWLTLAVVFLDRATKAWIDSRPESYFPHIIIPNFIELIRAHNPGIAFSFFADAPSSGRYLLIFGSVVIIGMVAWMLVASRQLNSLSAAGLALVLAGATGNVTDRLVHGAVTDFLQVWLHFLPWHIFNPWPTFNVADSAVTVGASLIIIDLLFRPQPAPPPQPQE